jgi:hypothetical protein
LRFCGAAFRFGALPDYLSRLIVARDDLGFCMTDTQQQSHRDQITVPVDADADRRMREHSAKKKTQSGMARE